MSFSTYLRDERHCGLLLHDAERITGLARPQYHIGHVPLSYEDVPHLANMPQCTTIQIHTHFTAPPRTCDVWAYLCYPSIYQAGHNCSQVVLFLYFCRTTLIKWATVCVCVCVCVFCVCCVCVLCVCETVNCY